MALIDKNVVVDAIDGTTWYHISNTGELVVGANSKTDIPLYKAEDIYKAVESVPEVETVDAVPVVHGRWKIKTMREYDLSYGGRIYIPEYICGCCGHYYESYVRGDEPIMPEDADFPMYCEQCGAKMDGKDEA